MHRQPQGAKRTTKKKPKPHPKEKSPSLKDNPLTGGRAGQVDLEVDQRSREHNGENQEPPKTRSLREDHPERGHQWLQGAKLSHRPRHKPQPAEMRVVYQRQPQNPSKGRGGNTEPQHGTGKNTRESQGQTKVMDTARTTWQHIPRDRARRNAAYRGVRSNQELTSAPDPNGETKPSLRSRRNDP